MVAPLEMSPQLINFWDYEKNIDIALVSSGSNKKFWWKCEKGHEWETSPNSLKRNIVCPVCNGRQILAGFNDLATTHPDIAAQWNATRNILLPSEVTYGSKLKVWWLGTCGHEWKASVGARATMGQGCAVCRGLQIQVGVNDLATTHPELVEEWHPTKNGELTVTQVTAGSGIKVWWLGTCGHEWQISPHHRTSGSQCYQCLGRRKPSKQPLLKNYPIFEELHPVLNGKLENLEMLRLKSNKFVWWLGKDCGHEWRARIVWRTSGQGCAVCHGSQIQVGVTDFASVHPELVAQWSEKNDKSPQQVTYRSHYMAEWVCEKGHEWLAKVQTRSTGHGCPSCAAATYVSRAERDIAEYVAGLDVGEVKTSVRNVIKGELDVYIPEKRIAVEFNGLYWHSENAGRGKFYHRDKWLACKGEGIQLIQIWEDDWNRNPELVKRMLAHKLGVSGGERIYARSTNVRVVPSAEVREFLEANHLQGYRAAKYWGLYTRDIENPVLVGVLGVQRKGENGIEIIRFATSCVVVGGFTKLLKYVLGLEQYFEVVEVFSYSHNDHSDGGVYERNGFVLVHDGAPGYGYWRAGWVERQNRLKFSPSRVRGNRELEFVEGATERELAALNGLSRVWDSGSSLWVLNL